MLTDLGNLGKTSFAFAISSKGQIVGASQINDLTVHAFLWENGGPMIDLNTLIAPNSNLQLTRALAINDRGQIAGNGVPPGCGDEAVCGHAYVLIPCGEGDEDCQGENPTGVSESSPAPATQRPTTATPANPALSGRGMLDRLRARRFPWYHVAGPGTGPTR